MSHSAPNNRTAVEVLVEHLVIDGVDQVFCVPGQSYLAVLDAFHDRDLAVSVCRQEGAAAMMADACLQSLMLSRAREGPCRTRGASCGCREWCAGPPSTRPRCAVGSGEDGMPTTLPGAGAGSLPPR